MKPRHCCLALALVAAMDAGMSAQQPPAASHPTLPPNSSLAKKIETLLADPVAARAHWGIVVTDLNGKQIYGLDETKLFRPASTAKLFTTAAAMALLGPAKIVETHVSLPEPDANGTVSGDVTLIGDYDDDLSGCDVPMRIHLKPPAQVCDPLNIIEEFANEIAKAGIHHITGHIEGSNWPWEPYPQGWDADDLVWGYGAPAASLGLDDNELRLMVTPGKAQGDAAAVTLQPDIGYYRIDSTVSTTDEPRSSISIHSDFVEKVLHVAGRVMLGHPYATEIAMDDPPLYVAAALKSKLEAQGITVDGASQAAHEFSGYSEDFLRDSKQPDMLPPEAIRLAQGSGGPGKAKFFALKHASPPLADDVAFTLKESQNLHAEMMLRRLGMEFGDVMPEQSSVIAQGARVVRQWLVNAGIDANDFYFYDGSGLSTKDLVTPRAEAQLLAFAAKQTWFAAWKAGLPVGGVDGTLAERFKEPPLKGHVFAKTGTLGESRALAGYLDCASGRQVIFSILVDNHPPGTSADKNVMDKIVAAIAASE